MNDNFISPLSYDTELTKYNITDLNQYTSPVFPVFHTATTVSLSQKLVPNDNIHSIILDTMAFN